MMIEIIGIEEDAEGEEAEAATLTTTTRKQKGKTRTKSRNMWQNPDKKYIYDDMNKYSNLILILVFKIESHDNVVHLPLFKSILYF